MAYVELDAGSPRGQVEPSERVDRHAVRRDAAEIAHDRPHRRNRRNAEDELIVAMSFRPESGPRFDPERKDSATR